jgi:predicted Zn-dependent protease
MIRPNAPAETSPRWPTRLVEAALALHDNRLADAEPRLRAHLKDDPFDVAAIRMMAELAGRIGRYKDAEALLRRALELSPDFTAARANLAIVLHRLNRPAPNSISSRRMSPTIPAMPISRRRRSAESAASTRRSCSTNRCSRRCRASRASG